MAQAHMFSCAQIEAIGISYDESVKVAYDLGQAGGVMGQKGLVLPNNVEFADLGFRYNSANGTFTIDLGAVLHFCDANEIDTCSVIPCYLEANNPGTAAMLERSTARLATLLDNWYTIHCAHSGVRDIAYERWLRRGEPSKRISRY